MKRKTLIFLFFLSLIIFVAFASAVDFIPQGDINLKGIYQIKNGTNITAEYFCNATACYTVSDFLQSAVGATVFTGLTDTPGSYVGANGQCVIVNETAGTLYFSTCSGTDTNASTACSSGEFLNGDGTCDTGFLDADGSDADTTYTNGSGISLVGTKFNHSDTSSQSSSDNSGNTFIQDILLDGFGHITSLVTGVITNIFDQDLNTTNSPTFVNLTLTGHYLNGINISNVSEGPHITDTTCAADGSCSLVVYEGDSDRVLLKYQNITNIPTCSGSDVLTFDGTTLSCTTPAGGTTYNNGTGLGLNASDYFSILLSYQFPQGCADGEIAEYNTTSGGWDCAIDNSAASGMASWVLAALGIGGSESITDGETVTFGSGNSYIDVSRSTNNLNYTLNDTILNQTIDARDSDSNASTACAGTTTYLDGEGNCDDISSVYEPAGITESDISDLAHVGNNGITLVEANITDLSHTVDTTDGNASSICANGEFLNGDGTCDAGFLDADGSDADTTYDNSSPISLSGTTFGLQTCSDGQIYKYNSTSGAWECESDQDSGTAGSSKWIDGGTYIYPNNTFADNVNVTGNLTVGTGAVSFEMYNNGTTIIFDTKGNNSFFVDNVTADYFFGKLNYSWIQNHPADSDTTYTNGSGISIVGTEVNHSDTSSQSSSDNSGRTYIQDILLDSFGHLTSIVTATETVVDTDTYNTSEEMQDAVGGILDGNFTYNDAGDSITVHPSNLATTLRTILDSVYRLVSDLIVNSDIASDSINTTQIIDGTIKDGDLDLTNITVADFTNDAGYITTDTNASTVCAGTTTYLDGEGNCDDISGVYEGTLTNEAGLYSALSDVSEFIETNDAATLVTLDTGQGANELYDMDQNVLTTSNVVFNQLNVSDHFRINTVNITCLNVACSWYDNATDSCRYWPSGGKDCGA